MDRVSGIAVGTGIAVLLAIVGVISCSVPTDVRADMAEGFEDGVSDWSSPCGNGGTWAEATDTVRSGTYSFKCNNGGDVSGVVKGFSVGKAKGKYIAKVWVNSSGFPDCGARIKLTDSAGSDCPCSLSGGTAASLSKDNQWTKIETSPVQISSSTACVTLTAGGENGTVIRFDDLSIEPEKKPE